MVPCVDIIPSKLLLPSTVDEATYRTSCQRCPFDHTDCDRSVTVSMTSCIPRFRKRRESISTGSNHTHFCSKKRDPRVQKYPLFVSGKKLFETAHHVTSKRYSISNWSSDSYSILRSSQPDCQLSSFRGAFVICFFFIVPKQQSAPLVSIDDRHNSFNATLFSTVSS